MIPLKIFEINRNLQLKIPLQIYSYFNYLFYKFQNYFDFLSSIYNWRRDHALFNIFFWKTENALIEAQSKKAMQLKSFFINLIYNPRLRRKYVLTVFQFHTDSKNVAIKMTSQCATDAHYFNYKVFIFTTYVYIF